MNTDITELNEAYTLSKSVKFILMKMLDGLPPGEDDRASVYYGLICLCESMITNQQKAIDTLIKQK